MTTKYSSNPIVVLGETKDFALEIGPMTIVPEFLKGELGYRLRNKRTGLVEQEGSSEGNAIRALYANQKYLDQVLDDPAGDKQPEPIGYGELPLFTGD